MYYLEIDKVDTSFTNVDEIISYLKEKIESHKVTRYIGVCDMKDKFVIDFLEASVQLANDTMEKWVKSITNQIEVAA